MIFVTVGAQMPFDRLIRAVDQWAHVHGRSDVFAQIGLAQYRPLHMQCTAFMSPGEFRKKIEQADVVIAHAGMGSILTALELGKPILVMPRRGDLRETRNDHQVATAKRFLAQGRIFVAFDEEHLLEKLDLLNMLRPTERIAAHASQELLTTLRAFIEGRELPQPRVTMVNEPVADVRAVPMRWQYRLAGVSGAGAGAGAGDRSVGRSPAPRVRTAKKYAAHQIKSRLAGMILLGGRLRPTELGRRAGRSRLDLPIDQNRSILAYWRDEAVDLAAGWNCPHLSLRVLLDRASPTPSIPASAAGLIISLERDKSEFRGTGGVLRDACAHYDDDDWVLVANAAQVLYGSLKNMADSLADAGGEINVVEDREGIPNGLILLRCGILQSIPDIGYHDMKEQVIPSLARRHAVKVVSTTDLTSHPIQSLKDYTRTLRSYHAGRADNRSGGGPSGERWQSQFSICEPGAVVAPTAVVHDSVILQGAVIGKGAVVIRSVVGQGARIRPGQKVFEEIVIGS